MCVCVCVCVYLHNLESLEMWYWRRMEISWTDRVRNEEVLHRIKEGRNYLTYNKRRMVNWNGHILCGTAF